MKFTRPTFCALKAYDKDLAVKTFMAARKNYSPITTKMLARDLEV